MPTRHVFVLVASDHRFELDLGEEGSAWSALVVAGGALGDEPDQRQEVRDGVPVTVAEVVTSLPYDTAVTTMEEETFSRFPALYRPRPTATQPPLPPIEERYPAIRRPIEDAWVLDEGKWAHDKWGTNPALEALKRTNGLEKALAAEVPPRSLYVRQGEDAANVGRLPGLRVLELNGEIPREIGYLRELVQLTAEGAGLKQLPDSIGACTELRGLYLSRNRIQALPESVGRLERLLELDLSQNVLEALPDAIGDLGALRFLNLEQNRLRHLPRSIGRLQRLETLSLRHDKHIDATQVFDVLGPCGALRTMDLTGAVLPTTPFLIPPALRTLTWHFGYGDEPGGVPFNDGVVSNPELISLAWSARCAALPESFGLLTKLESLDLSDNRLSDLPASFVELRALRTLDLSQESGLSKLPPVLLEMPWIESLTISCREFVSLPEDIDRLRLYTLSLPYCKLQHLPASIVRMPLRVLNLDGNRLVTLPEGMEGLTQLEELNLGSAELSTETVLALIERGLPALKKLAVSSSVDRARLRAARPSVEI